MTLKLSFVLTREPAARGKKEINASPERLNSSVQTIHPWGINELHEMCSSVRQFQASQRRIVLDDARLVDEFCADSQFF